MASRRKRAKGNHHREAHAEAIRYANRYGWHCHWCGCLLDAKTITGDHLTPLSMGGSDREPNIVPACKDCNRKRDNQPAYR